MRKTCYSSRMMVENFRVRNFWRLGKLKGDARGIAFTQKLER